MINLYYSEAYWGHSQTMNGPHKVVKNLLMSLEQEKIDYAINEEKYKNNFLLQYDWTGHVKHSELELENCIIGPQIWMFDELGNIIPGFPLYGNSTIDLTNANEDEYLEFVTKSIESEIILYRLY